jgi:hypothetical protein
MRFRVGLPNADLHRPVRNRALKRGRICPVDRKDLAVIERVSILLEAVALHPQQDLVQISALEHVMLLGPGHRDLIRNEDFRLMAGFGEGLFGGDAIAVIEVVPRGNLMRQGQNASCELTHTGAFFLAGRLVEGAVSARRRSNQLHPLETRMPVLADNDVVMHRDAERAGDADDRLGHLDVGLRGRRIAAGVVVHQDQRGCG